MITSEFQRWILTEEEKLYYFLKIIRNSNPTNKNICELIEYTQLSEPAFHFLIKNRISMEDINYIKDYTNYSYQISRLLKCGTLDIRRPEEC